MPTFELDGYEVINGQAKATGNGAHVHVPKRWRGTNVKIVRTSETEDEIAEKTVVLLRFEGKEDIVDAMTDEKMDEYDISDDQILDESELVMDKEHLPASAMYALGERWSPGIPQPGMEEPETGESC